MEEEKAQTSDATGHIPIGSKNTTHVGSENTTHVLREVNIKGILEGSPGFKPADLTFDDEKIWNEEYSNLSSEKKMLLETQEQTKLIRRISKNVLFYFWLTIISFLLYIMVFVLV